MTEGREIPLHFTQTGNGANALVFFHGFLDDGSFWRSTIEALEARDFSVVTLDFPGVGNAADDPGPFSLDRLVQAVASVVDAVGRLTVLVGHSMGARDFWGAICAFRSRLAAARMRMPRAYEFKSAPLRSLRPTHFTGQEKAKNNFPSHTRKQF